MNIRFLLILSLCLLASTDSIGQLAAWDFSGENTVPTSAAEIFSGTFDSSNLVTRGSGAAASAGANSFRTTGFQNNGIATTNTDYFEVTLSTTSGFVLSLSTIDARLTGTASFAAGAGVTSQFAYSLDGTNFTLIGSPQVLAGIPQNLAQIDLTGISALQNISHTTTVTFRYYASGQTTTGGWGFASTAAPGTFGLQIGGSIIVDCPTPPATPPGTISGTTPACSNTTLTYTGTAPIAPVFYYWQSSPSGTSIFNNATSTLNVTANGTYYVRAFNSSTSCWSTATTGYPVVINNPISVTTQPANVSVPETNNTSFSVVATNVSAFQWQVSTDGGLTYSNVANGGIYSGATTATLNLTGVLLTMNNYRYQCILTGNAPCSSVTTSSAILTVTSITSSGSDIVAVASSEAATISSLVNTATISLSTQGVQVWQITIRDGGAGFNDSDTLPTILTSFTLAQAAGNQVVNWTNAIQSVGLFEGTTFIANASNIASTQIQFTGLNYSVPDGQARTLSLRISLRCPLGLGANDGEDFGFSLSNVNTNFSGTGSGKASFSAISSANSFNVIDVTATQLAFSVQPTSTGINNTMSTVTVRATDICGNLDINFTGAVSLTSTGTMSPVTPVAAVGGVANFSTITHTVTGTNLTLTASAAGLTFIISTFFDILNSTTLQPGDIAILAFNTALASGDDEITFVTFVDITPGTRLDITDNAFEKCATPNGWGISEGWIRLERTNTTLPRGSIVTVNVTNAGGNPSVVAPAADIANWNCTKPQPGLQGTFNLNNGGEQIFFMTGGNVAGPNANTATSDAGTYSGLILYGFNTKGNVWTPICGNSAAGGTQNSAKPINFDCFLTWPTAQADLCKYTGPLTDATQRDWLSRINDSANWTGYISNANYAAGPDYYTAPPIVILPGTAPSNGVWIGNRSTNWFDCGNWQSLKVPDATVNVIVGTNATQSVVIDATAPSASSFGNVANCRDLTISNQSVRIEAAISNVLNVNGNLLINGTGILDMDDNNAGTADGQLNLFGNWNNTLGNNSFLEGNGTVQFTGTGIQTINTVVPLGTESFNNVILNNNFDTGLSNDLVATNSLTVNASRTLTIDSANGYVRVNNDLINNGNILIDNNGQLIQVNEIDNNSGDYTSAPTRFQVRRTAQAKDLDFIYWSSPINNFNVSGLPTDNRFAWSPTATNANGTQGTWQAAAGVMLPGKGYIARASNGAATPTALPLTFNSGRPNNGQFTFGITRGTITTPPNAFTTEFDDNWNLVGNPYPSAIDAEEFLVANQTKIQGSVWIWKHGLVPSVATSPFYENFIYNYSSSDYIKYNGLGSTEPDTFAGKIALGQGFMVSMLDTAGVSNTLLFTNNMRSDASFGAYDNADFFRIGTPPSETIEEKSRIWLDIFNNTSGQMDRTLMGYSTNSTMGIDHIYDCVFVPRLDVSLFSIVEDKPFIIQGRAMPFDINDRVPMGINIMEAGSHTIAIHKTDGLFEGLSEIYIEDALLNITHDLKQAPYIFTSDIGLFNNRFSIKYTNTTLGNPEFENTNAIVVSTKNKIITVTSSIEKMDAITVFDVLGRELFSSKENNSNQITIDTISQSNQALIVKIKLNNGKTLTRKTVL
jgi:hypothetical protein